MTPGCPNIHCHSYLKKDAIIRKGFYFRKDDSRKIARFECKICRKKFSSATFKLEYRQKKRRINHQLFKLFSSGMSMRRSARHLGVHYVTVQRKLIYLAKKAKKSNKNFLFSLRHDPVKHLQFDDLITSVHTKLKPFSISIAVDADRRFILGAKVSEIPAFGHLAELSRRKYGRRKNEHEKNLNDLLSEIVSVIHPLVQIESDEHRAYAPAVELHFPQSTYRQYKGEKGCVAGQGELKKVHYDPLFKINHTCAMLRANINRLFRRTWCTSKKKEMLEKHLEIYIAYHNQELLN